MPYQLDTHVLTVDANVIHKVDTANPANLYSMWTVFSRCADSVEQGRRLENLSWRIWQKEKLAECGNHQTTSAAPNSNTSTQSLPQDIPSDTRISDVPALSGSVDSIADADETVEITSVSAPLEIVRPKIQRQDSSTSSKSNFEKLIVSIVQDKEPLSVPTQPKITTMAPVKDTWEPQPSLERSGSTTTESQSPSKASDRSIDSQPSPEIQPSKTNVIRGFFPSSIPTTQITPPKPSMNATIPEPASSPAAQAVLTKNSKMFQVGCSPSSSEQSHTPEPRKKRMFQVGAGSSEEEGSLKSALSPRVGGGLASHKKQTSFSNVVTTHHVDDDDNDNAIDSDDSEDDYIDESAIDDDDDSSDWEDSIEESGKSSVDDKYFKRVDSKVNLTSRRSLITLMLAQGEERSRKLGSQASQSTSALPRAAQTPALGASPNDSDEAPLMMKAMRQSNLRPIAEAPRSTPQAIPAPSRSSQAQGALSPRTTRRNMLATELTESLRRHLLWERQQKSATANAVMKRRHTSHDVANLKQYPEQACMKKSEDVNVSSWNQYFAKETGDSYHSKGW